MKNLRIQIDNTLHHRLKALCDHHGELSNLVRRAIRQYINSEEAKNDRNTKIPRGPTTRPKPSD